jgi:dTDP-glucose 4,6-dehydratase
MKVLVTGGAGFIGSNFVRKLVDGSLPGATEITVIDKLTYAGNLHNLESLPRNSFRFIHGDIRDQTLISKIVSDQDILINFAAESHVDRSITGAREFIETNVLGTQILLEAALQKDLIFVQISTDEVYGSIATGSWKEDCPLLPNSPYAASKASADLLCRSYHETYCLDVRITRCSNNYGPYQFPEKIIPLFVTNLIEGKKVPLYGNGSNIRDWLHVDDHIQGINAVIQRGKAGEIYNIGGGREMSNYELTKVILDSMQKDDSHIEYVSDRKGHDFRYSVDIEKISTEIAYKPSVSFEEGIASTINWYMENQQWWRPLKS